MFTEYNPDTEDGTLTLPAQPAGAMFVLAAGTALRIFIGIRNSPDIVTYIVITSNDEPDK